MTSSNKKSTEPRHILHLDMDAFYASVEVLDNPDLRGRPVIVGGTRQRGVVSAASYEAREFGIHSAQPIATARRLCPHGVYLPVRMSRYKEVSDRIFEIFRRFTPLVEPLSLDEAFLDVTGSIRLFGEPTDIAEKIRRLVREEIGLTVSAGVAPSKLVAKIASDINKPDGLTVVPADGVREFLDPLPIGKLWGVGKATKKALGLLGIETMGDLARVPREVLDKKFGASGRHLADLTRGIDGRGVTPERETKSIGAEQTYSQDIIQLKMARKELLNLAVRVSRRMRRHGFQCRTVTLKVKYNDFKQITRSESVPRPTDEAQTIYRTVSRLLEETAVGRRPARLLGISLSNLTTGEDQKQTSFFDSLDESIKGRDLDRATDKISEKFGNKAILPATLLNK